MSEVKLTQYSHGSGCGCKISPKVLDSILQSNFVMPSDDNLLVGNQTRDDAAVYDIGNDQAIISTTDFFMPIVDAPIEGVAFDIPLKRNSLTPSIFDKTSLLLKRSTFF